MATRSIFVGKKCKKWTEEAMKSAVEALGDVSGDEETVISLMEAVKRFNVLVETL